jgi:Protein-tyrosine phosphatase
VQRELVERVCFNNISVFQVKFIFVFPGTMMVIYDSISRFMDTKTIEIRETVTRFRTQRAQAVETSQQYQFCYQSLIDYAKRYLLETSNLIQSSISSEI